MKSAINKIQNQLSKVSKYFFTLNKKNRIKFIIIVGVILLVPSIIVASNIIKNKKEQENKDEIRTFTLKNDYIVNAITVSGKTKSTNMVNVSTTNAGKVTKINFKVGDKVKESDVIMTLDSTDILKEIAALKKNISKNEQEAKASYKLAIDSRTTAYDNMISSQKSYNSYKIKSDASYNNYQKALLSINKPLEEYNIAFNDEVQKGMELNKAINENNNVTQAQNNYEQASNNRKDKEDLLNKAKANCNFAYLEDKYNADMGITNSAKEQYLSLQSAYITAKENEKAARSSLEATQKSAEMDELNKKLDACTVKAQANGTITAIGAVVGSAPSQEQPLAIIQDIDSLAIASNIKEFDISKIKLGQEVTIKSDATKGKTISGKVSQISMTANTDEAAGVTFPVQIQVTTPKSELMVGMNVKAEIILSKSPKGLVVPIDAVGRDGQGNDVVYVKEGKQFKATKVVLGMSNDYYVQIKSSKLKEGMAIRGNANEDESVMLTNDK